MEQQMNEKVAFLNKYTLSSEKKVELITDESTISNVQDEEIFPTS